MAEQVSLFIPTLAIGKQRPRFAKFGKYVHTYTPKKTKTFENIIASEAYRAINGATPYFTGAVEVEIIINVLPPPTKIKSKANKLLFETGNMPLTTKPDIDNCIKAIFDAMNKIIFKDDSQVVSLIAKKQYGKENLIEIYIRGNRFEKEQTKWRWDIENWRKISNKKRLLITDDFGCFTH